MSDPDRYTLVLLRRPEAEPALAPAELEAVQARRVEYLDELRSQGTLVAAGGLANAPDASWTGLLVLRADFREARELADRDPLVLAGMRDADLATWLVPPGLLPAA